MQKTYGVYLCGEYENSFITALKKKLHSSVDLIHGTGIPAKRDFRALVSGRPERELLDAGTSLEALIIPWAGLPAATASMVSDYPGIRVYNIHHNAGAAAEMAVALMLAAAKKIVPAHNAFSRGDWTIRYTPGSSMLVSESSILVLGWGAIGRRAGAICRSMGASVKGIRRKTSATGKAENVFPPGMLHELLPETDILIVSVPLTPDTRGLIGDAELSLLPSHAVLVNVARGEVVCEEALFRHLSTGSIGAAGLDVWYNYPGSESARRNTPPSDYPFGELENVVMSPHRGGAFGIDQLEELRAVHLADSINALAGGEVPSGRVDLELGY